MAYNNTESLHQFIGEDYHNNWIMCHIVIQSYDAERHCNHVTDIVPVMNDNLILCHNGDTGMNVIYQSTIVVNSIIAI